MSADAYEELAAEYLSTMRVVVFDTRASDFAEELSAEMVTLSNLARAQSG